MVDIAQLVRASDCGSEGRGFESLYPPQMKARKRPGEKRRKGRFFPARSINSGM